MPGIGIQMSERWVGGWMELADRKSKYSGNRRVFLAAGTGSFLILSVRTPGFLKTSYPDLRTMALGSRGWGGRASYLCVGGRVVAGLIRDWKWAE